MGAPPRCEVYTYDLDDSATYRSENNRLMFVERYESFSGEPFLYSTKWYYYNDVGNVERILTKEEFPSPGDSQFKATRLHYAANQVAVTYILGEHWDWDGVVGSRPTRCQSDKASGRIVLRHEARR